MQFVHVAVAVKDHVNDHVDLIGDGDEPPLKSEASQPPSSGLNAVEIANIAGKHALRRLSASYLALGPR